MSTNFWVGVITAAVLVAGVVAIVTYVHRKTTAATRAIANWWLERWQGWIVRRDQRRRERSEKVIARQVHVGAEMWECIRDKERQIAELQARLAPAPQPASAPQPSQGLLALADELRALRQAVCGVGDRLTALERIQPPPKRPKLPQAS